MNKKSNQILDVHPLTADPTVAWKKLAKNQLVIAVNLNPPNEVSNDKIRVVCMSDTHSISRYQFTIPNGDIFIHAGDFTRYGDTSEIIAFNDWIGTLPHKHKIVIAGNHELSFDPKFADLNGKQPPDAKKAKDYLTNCTYLEDSFIELFGLKIYGSPWQPEFRNWAFNLPRGKECLSKWNMIPDDTDILVTHGPPIGHGDLCHTGLRAGCVDLLTTIQQRVQPKYHIFGHIHEGYGITSDGSTTYINAATCNQRYEAVNLPIVFDIDLPTGVKKT